MVGDGKRTEKGPPARKLRFPPCYSGIHVTEELRGEVTICTKAALTNHSRRVPGREEALPSAPSVPSRRHYPTFQALRRLCAPHWSVPRDPCLTLTQVKLKYWTTNPCERRHLPKAARLPPPRRSGSGHRRRRTVHMAGGRAGEGRTPDTSGFISRRTGVVCLLNICGLFVVGFCSVARGRELR